MGRTMRVFVISFLLAAGQPCMAAPDAEHGKFMVAAAEEFTVENPTITGLRILLTPSPAAVVFGEYASGCVTTYPKASFMEKGNNIDIRVMGRKPAGAMCTAVMGPFVEALSLAGVSNPETRTYSVNGVPIVAAVEPRNAPAR
jgi:hypothetical protein